MVRGWSVILAACIVATWQYCAALDVDVRVIVLRLPGGGADSSAPYFDESPGTMPLEASGDVVLNGDYSLATDLAEADINEVFEQVNAFYAPAQVRWVPKVIMAEPTVPCGDQDMVCGKYKCRSHDYFVKYFGTINKKISKSGREERAVNFLSLVPREHFVKGEYHVLYIKYIGISSQGVVVGSLGDPFLRADSDSDHISVATVGAWSNKFTPSPIKRPNVVPCDGKQNCGLGLAYTTAHELGHLLALGHTDPGSIMSGGGAGPTGFSSAQIAGIKSWFGGSSSTPPRLINSQFGQRVNLPGLYPTAGRSNEVCGIASSPTVSPTTPQVNQTKSSSERAHFWPTTSLLLWFLARLIKD